METEEEYRRAEWGRMTVGGERKWRCAEERVEGKQKGSNTGQKRNKGKQNEGEWEWRCAEED